MFKSNQVSRNEILSDKAEIEPIFQKPKRNHRLNEIIIMMSESIKFPFDI